MGDHLQTVAFVSLLIHVSSGYMIAVFDSSRCLCHFVTYFNRVTLDFN